MRLLSIFVLASLALMLGSCHAFHSKPADTTIYIQPFYPFSIENTNEIALEIKKFYHCKVIVLPERKIFDTARSGSGRYSAAILLSILDKQVNEKNAKILALTSYDIFCENHGVKEWGIFGLGNCPGRACVVSDFRLKWFPEKTQEFTINVVLHELGHTFGLAHCDRDERCLMTDAKGGIKALYKEKRILCAHCLSILGLNHKQV